MEESWIHQTGTAAKDLHVVRCSSVGCECSTFVDLYLLWYTWSNVWRLVWSWRMWTNFSVLYDFGDVMRFQYDFERDSNDTLKLVLDLWLISGRLTRMYTDHTDHLHGKKLVRLDGWCATLHDNYAYSVVTMCWLGFAGSLKQLYSDFRIMSSSVERISLY